MIYSYQCRTSKGGNSTLEEGGDSMADILIALSVNVAGTVIGGLIVSYIVKKWF